MLVLVMSRANNVTNTVWYGILLAGSLFCFTQFVSPARPHQDASPFEQEVNLALRRTADHLLRQSGDAISRIEPVRQLNAHTFSIRLTHSFQYDHLPHLLDESFRAHHIQDSYDVTVRDCTHGEVQLGYSFLDLSDSTQIPCVGRQQPGGCYDLQVTFRASAENPGLNWWWVLPMGMLWVGVAYAVRRKPAPEQPLPVTTVPVVPVTAPGSEISFGESVFAFAAQTLTSGQEQHNLTYREAKLLRFLLDHPNEIVSRDLILKSVWEDEGVTVGRSVDVFISRLRKLLQHDPSVRIAAIHGVGYRLEIQQ